MSISVPGDNCVHCVGSHNAIVSPRSRLASLVDAHTCRADKREINIVCGPLELGCGRVTRCFFSKTFAIRFNYLLNIKVYFDVDY